MILAQASVEVPWKYLPPWLFGFIAFLSVVLLGLLVVYYGKKVFGRRPPIDDALKDLVKTLRSELHRETNSVRKEMRLKLEAVDAGAEKFEDAIEARVTKVETGLEDVQLDRARKWEALTREMHEIANNVAYLRGQENERQNKS